MNTIFDLSITLTAPPADAPPDAIASIALRSDPQGLTHTGDLLTDPLTQQERSELQWYLEDYWKWPYEQFAQRGKHTETLLDTIGKRLYETIFGKVKADRIVQAWRLHPLQPGDHRQISIISDIPHVLSLPWELLHDEQGFLVLRTRTPISLLRRLPQHELAAFQTTFEPPLRILLVTARPDNVGFIDPRSTARELLDAMHSQIEQGTILLEFLRPPTLAALRKRLQDTQRSIHVLHFDGHGIFEGQPEQQDGHRKSGGEQGKLAFETAQGTLDLVEAGVLAQVLQDSGIRLAMLDACQSAMGSANDAFSSVATRLIQGGVDGVVAMSASVLVASTALFFAAFYRELAAGTAAPTAQERARQALHDDPRRHLHRRRPDEEAQPVTLKDWWLPHYYQQRPLLLQPTKPARKSQKRQATSSTPRLNTDMPAEPRYGFSGRSRELLHLERHLLRGKLVVISGFGGIGKTALVREAADWLTRTGMYSAACFVSFVSGGDTATLLSALGTFLGINDSTYNPNDPPAALARLKPALQHQPTLLIADNLETILPHGEAPLDAATRSLLWSTLLDLAQLGAGVLLTSRDTHFGDGRLAPSSTVAHLPLSGLHPEDAYDLASRLLLDLDIDRARAPYSDLRDLLIHLDHHPFAIHLVLPALRTYPLATIRTDFAALLPNFVDDTTTGNNRSLLASLDYSLQRLSAKQQELLTHLAPFEGGAMEVLLLEITEISQPAWGELRLALEQAALLTIEQVPPDFRFLHFHPVLTPFLRSRPAADDAKLCERYALRYFILIDNLRSQDPSYAVLVRAMVRRELPNLRRALAILLELGDLEMVNASGKEVAFSMADSLAKFLGNFGLIREREELRRRVEEVVAAAGNQAQAELTQEEYRRKSALGRDTLEKGNLRPAYAIFMELLKRIEALPEGMEPGRGSYEHCQILSNLAFCLGENGQVRTAEGLLHKALTIINALIRQHPDNQVYIYHRGTVLLDWGQVMADLGHYQQARAAFEEAVEVATQQGDLQPLAVGLSSLGLLALEQGDYVEAKFRLIKAHDLHCILGEPARLAVSLFQLGRVAAKQETWDEAEQYFRESLELREYLGNLAQASETCNSLGVLAERTGRPAEAEGWYKRALALSEQVHKGDSSLSMYLTNLALHLLVEVQVGRAPKGRLAEARSYAERALAIKEKLDESVAIWTTVHALASIADLEGRTEAAQDYRRRERETFAAFEGNRYHIDRQHGPLIAAIAAAAMGDAQARVAVEEALPMLEANGWRIAAATQRIWAGERDWHSLVEDLHGEVALLVLRVLETIAQPTQEKGDEA